MNTTNIQTSVGGNSPISKSKTFVSLELAKKPSTGIKPAYELFRLDDLEGIEVKENEIILRVSASGGIKRYSIYEIDTTGKRLAEMDYEDILVEIFLKLGLEDVVKIPLLLKDSSGRNHSIRIEN